MGGSNGWTGGQYSLYRAVFGAYLLLWFGSGVSAGVAIAPTLLHLLGAAASVLLIAGWQDRSAAAALILLLPATQGVDRLLAQPGLLGLTIVLAVHAATAGSPYGSWSARGRPDPAGDWRLKLSATRVAWLALILLLGYQALADPTGGALRWIRVGLAALAGLAATSPRLRPRVWLFLLVLQLLGPLAASGATLAGGLVLLQLLVFAPEWIAPEPATGPEMLFYDGACGLCHRTVRFILAEDPNGSGFRFSPLQGRAFRAAIEARPRTGLPDSIVLRRNDGALLVRSAAVLHIGRRLGGLWRILAEAADLVPQAVLDALYDGVARVRKQVFPTPQGACPVVTPELSSRFED